MEELQTYYDEVLNMDKSTYRSTNDEPTPIACVREMIDAIPEELWTKENLAILDPCCGNGNFFVPILFKLREYGHTTEAILGSILTFNDINTERLENVRRVFQGAKNVRSDDFLTGFSDDEQLYDLIVANPPYAKLMPDGKRASKNHNLVGAFIEKALGLLKPGGYLVFLTPDNWMSRSDRNTLIQKLTALRILRLDIHGAKKYFKRIGSSFTWYVVQNSPICPGDEIHVTGLWNKRVYADMVPSGVRSYIPLMYTRLVHEILRKTVDDPTHERFKIETSSDLHRYTKRALIVAERDEAHPFRLVHTPKQTVWASRAHKYQESPKVFLSTTDTYKVFVDTCGMTQSIAFIQCVSAEEAERIRGVLEHPLYVCINNICRWGNFNNVRILQQFPKPTIAHDPYTSFGITEVERAFVVSCMPGQSCRS